MKRVAAVAVLGVAALAARRYLTMRDAMAAVAADLRNPLLPLPSPSSYSRRCRCGACYFSCRTRPGRGVTVTKHYVGDPAFRVLVTTPTEGQSPRPAVLWIHGGGYIVGSPQLEAMWAGRLARDLGVVTVSPDYRLAPEHPFPAALDDCMATLTWMRANADELGIDPDRIAVVGASAGGGLAAAVAQRSHDEGIPLRAQVLVYPMLDDRTALREDHAGRGRFLWTPRRTGSGGRRIWGGSRGCRTRRNTRRRRGARILPGCRRRGSASANSTCSTTRMSTTPRG